MTELKPRKYNVVPIVIKNLMIINGLVFLAQITLGRSYATAAPGESSDMDNMFALHYWGSSYFRPYQLITHLFMHANLLHLITNMFSLWLFGSILEKLWGPKRFLVFYLLCGGGAALLYMGVLAYENAHLAHDVQRFLSDPTTANFTYLDKHYDLDAGIFQDHETKAMFLRHPHDPDNIYLMKSFLRQFMDGYRNTGTLGASGAVFGILFAFGYLFPNTKLNILPIKAKYVVGAYMLLELVLGFQNTPTDDVAHFAHLSGALISFILLRAWARSSKIMHFH